MITYINTVEIAGPEELLGARGGGALALLIFGLNRSNTFFILVLDALKTIRRFLNEASILGLLLIIEFLIANEDGDPYLVFDTSLL